MKVWVYALREGLRSVIVLEITLLFAVAVTYLIFNGFVIPPSNLVDILVTFAILVGLFVFPVFVIGKRYEVRRNNRKKVN